MAPDGIITTLAGTGVANYTGDGGAAQNATFDSSFGVAVSPLGGTVAIADLLSHVVRTIAPGLPFTVTQATPTVSLASNPSGSSVIGSTVTLTATVTPPFGGTVSGSVDFSYIDSSGVVHDLGSDPIVAGQAHCQTSALPIGTIEIAAQYSGNADFTPATLPLSSSSTIVTVAELGTVPGAWSSIPPATCSSPTVPMRTS